jgi:predicted nucleotide-binding protein (sugar kinase/HSP70/actin superfamily)
VNQHDRDNLDFLLNASPEVIQDWYEKMEDDDIMYAFELLELAKEELIEQQMAGNDLSEARAIISKYI